MSPLAAALWLGMLGAGLLWHVRLVARARQVPRLSRVAVMLAALATAGLAASGAYVWGVQPARRGMERIANDSGLRQRGDAGQHAPARARLFLRQVQMQLSADADAQSAATATVGYSPDAALRLPRGYGLSESKQGWDVLTVAARGPQGLAIGPAAAPEATDTRVLLAAEPYPADAPPTQASLPERVRASFGARLASCRSAPADRAKPSGAATASPRAPIPATQLSGPGAIFAVLCADRRPRAALVFERALGAQGDREIPIRVTPLVWTGRSFRPHHVQIASGSLIQIGAMSDALPGVTLWEVPTPSGRAELFYPPDDLLADCDEWLSGRHGEGFISLPAGPGPDPIQSPWQGGNRAICVLPFTPPFGLEVRRLLPDLPGIQARSLWAAGLAVTPALLALLLCGVRRRGELEAAPIARLMTLAWLSTLWSAASVWRLLWAHRIDMLRDYEAVGGRVLGNQLAAVLVAAALAATAASLLPRAGPSRRRRGPTPTTSWARVGAAAAAWALWLVAGGYALRGDLGQLSWSPALIGQGLLSLAVGTALTWAPSLAQRVARYRAQAAAAAATTAEAAAPRWPQGWLLGIAGLAAIALVATLTAALAPRAVALKLALAWSLPFGFYAALRAAIRPPGPDLLRVLLTAVAAAVAGLALARLDPGVSVAVAGPGALLALLVASHDACFGEDALAKMRGYQRHLAPLQLAHAGLLGLLGAAVFIACARGLIITRAGETDAALARSFTTGAIHLVAALAALFIAAAALLQRRRGLRPALPWLVLSAALGLLWAARGPLIDRLLESSSQAAHRLAIVLDPGYALLHGESKFLAGITAWRETIIPAAHQNQAGLDPLVHGQGYFGAQLIDPGVLLSIENDYFPVLVLREAGIAGVLATAALLALLAAAIWWRAGARFRPGSSPQREALLGAILLALVALYQPLAALGALPLTGISWPGFGLDSPSDLWLLMILALWLLVWNDSRGDVQRPPDARADGPAEDITVRSSRGFRRVRLLAAATALMLALAALVTLARASMFALRRPNPVDVQGRTVAPFDGLTRAVDYAYRLQCPWSYQRAPDPERLVPQELLGDPAGAGVIRFHRALRASWRDQRGRAVAEIERFLATPTGAGTGTGEPARPACGHPGQPYQVGDWRFERNPDRPDECRMHFKSGWPEVTITVTRTPEPEPEQEPEPAPAPEPKPGSTVESPAQSTTESSTESKTPPAATSPAAAAAADATSPTSTSPTSAPPTSETELAATETSGSSSAADTAAVLAADAPPEPVHVAHCEIDIRTDILRALKLPARRPYRGARIRLLSRAMGAAARDVGELVSGQVAVRLRPGAGPVDVAHARPGLYAGDEIEIGPELSVVAPASEDQPALLRLRSKAPEPAPGAAPAAAPEGLSDRATWLFVRDRPLAQVRALAAEEGTWRLLPPDTAELALDNITLIVVDGPDARSLWLFRPPQAWSAAGPDHQAVVDPLLADDITTVRGERRRHYLYGGLVPELGWVNPFQSRMSLGLDGWLRVAMSEYERVAAERATAAPPTWLDGSREVPYCSALEMAAPEPASADPQALADARLARVCRPSPLDGVLECRVSLQPELSIQLRHLTELISLAPTRFAGPKSVAPVRAQFALLRGDSGELVAQGEFVPGRASSAYAPSSPEIERYLVRLREDRDPSTGRRLPPERRGEASAEKAEWSRPIAVGSTMKPMLARAFEQADPARAAALELRGAPQAAARCRNRKIHALLGHCPPTNSLWNLSGSYNLAEFIAASVNWYQAALGLLGTALPGGAWGFGEPPPWPQTVADEPLPDAADPTAGNLGAHPPAAALWTRYQGRDVVTADGQIDIAALRRTPMWQRFEALIGRPLCTAGSKQRCRRAHTRRDLCAARALPIAQPSRDLRHLVALGPQSFDFYPPLADPQKRLGERVSTREYLQFLRGSGLHPLGSLAQMSDAFNRLVFGRVGDPERAPAYQLGASWFPVPESGALPAATCDSDPGRARAGGTDATDVRAGLCQVLQRGSARQLRPLLADPRISFYGAKTGTIDSLADIAEARAACEHFRTGHTVPDRPAKKASQPYWLACGKRRADASINDSLLLVSFAVEGEAGPVPLTLGLRFQRSGPGFATEVARHYLALIHSYFAAPAATDADADTAEDDA